MAENKKKTEEMEAAAEQHESINGAELLEDEILDGAEDVEEGDEALEGEPILSGLVLMREMVKSKRDPKRSFAVYNVHGKIRGQEVKVGMKPADNGGYAVLDLVYEEAKGMPLWMVPYEMTDDKTGRVTSGFTYKVEVLVEGGVTLPCKVKPSRDSDKRLLECLIALEKVRSGEAKA